jgi:L-lactate dehydrogenase complex protein LldG
MATRRDTILSRLRAAHRPFADEPPVSGHLPMVPLIDTSPSALRARFVEQAEKLGSVVHRPPSEAAAVDAVLALLGGDTRVLSWAFEHIPLAGWGDALVARGVTVAETRDPSVRVGVTGADAALAATGSLVLATGPGKHRVTSLLPPLHVAVLREAQIVADLETWLAIQRQQGLAAFQQTASVVIVSGPSRTADIAMQLTMGMHGPAELHIVLVGS